jgi:hypothetical protein
MSTFSPAPRSAPASTLADFTTARSAPVSGDRCVCGSCGSENIGKADREDQPALDLVAEGGTQIVWEDRWHEEEIFASRLSFYLLAQSFLVFAAVEATLSTDAASRWLPLALVIDLAGLTLTLVFWYALTENLRRLDALKEIVAQGSPEVGIPGYREIGAIRATHHERRSKRRLPFPLSILPSWSPSWWLAHWIPGLLGSMWIALITTAILSVA